MTHQFPIDETIALLQANADEKQAVPMQNYMRNLFPFLGIPSPKRRELTKDLLKTSRKTAWEVVLSAVEKLWKMPEREFQYLAIDMLVANLKRLKKKDLHKLEHLISTKSWWDTVDLLAGKVTGKYFMLFPEEMKKKTSAWSGSDNMWLQRSSILFQLGYKQRTNEKLLSEYILQHAGSKEFFLQKAIGWALREYSKNNPEFVRHFIENHSLPPLSVREASKYLY
jgi:3-methyladenine DNA glycosylase AlkD